ncbi:MAG: hypothetical protein IK017_07830 [Paludibacteraceae bacterium]|nr:hypothetical protein [Paludibacteraceae bacterium]
MNKKQFIAGLLCCSFVATAFAVTPNNMQIWLKDGGQQVFDISEVDSVTFGEAQQPEYRPLMENTMIPVFSKPNPLVISEQELPYVKATNEFGTKCYAEIRKSSKSGVNFFSPISLNIALGLCANGADGIGANEITKALGFRSDNAIDDMNNFFKKITLSLYSNVDSVTVRTANALWLNENSIVNMDFVKTAQEKYFATVRHLDFKNDPSGSKDTIDHWAALMTNNCIDKLNVKINEFTRFVINNACYFKGSWVKKFTPIGKILFNGMNDQKDSTYFMRVADEYFEYYETDDYQVVKLDYGISEDKPASSQYQPYTPSNSSYSMIVLLPRIKTDLDSVLPTVRWDSIPFEPVKGVIYMPKFKAAGGYPLKEILNKFNIEQIFNTCPNVVYREPIYVSEVQQDFFINVDEDGTEAAAVTSIIGVAGGVAIKSFDMYCNRPFVFAIRENKSGLLLFIGEYDSVPVSKE